MILRTVSTPQKPSILNASMHRQPRTSHQQDGVSLIIALIVLMAMSLAGLAMLRSVSSGLGIAGNVAFKQNATSGADQGIEAGRSWILSNTTMLNVDNTANGYFASWNKDFNPVTYDWGDINDSGNVKAKVLPALSSDGTDGTGNRIRFVIHRLCDTAGAPSVILNCVLVPGAIDAGSGGGGAAGPSLDSVVKRPYYRITARVDGPRNTVSYTQIIMF